MHIFSLPKRVIAREERPVVRVELVREDQLQIDRRVVPGWFTVCRFRRILIDEGAKSNHIWNLENMLAFVSRKVKKGLYLSRCIDPSKVVTSKVGHWWPINGRYHRVANTIQQSSPSIEETVR